MAITLNLIITNNTTRYNVHRYAYCDSTIGINTMSLHTGSPGTNGANEIPSQINMYQRKSVAWSYSGTSTNPCTVTLATTSLRFIIPKKQIQYIGIWDSNSRFSFYIQASDTWDYTSVDAGYFNVQNLTFSVF